MLGVHVNSVIRLEQEGLPVAQPGAGGKASLYDPAAIVAWWLARHRARGGSGDGLDPAAERARRDKAQANLAEQMHATRAGELIPRSELERILSPVVTAIRAKLLAGPRAWAPVLANIAASHGVAGIERELATRIRDVLTALSGLTGAPRRRKGKTA